MPSPPLFESALRSPIAALGQSIRSVSQKECSIQTGTRAVRSYRLGGLCLGEPSIFCSDDDLHCARHYLKCRRGQNLILHGEEGRRSAWWQDSLRHSIATANRVLKKNDLCGSPGIHRSQRWVSSVQIVKDSGCKSVPPIPLELVAVRESRNERFVQERMDACLVYMQTLRKLAVDCCGCARPRKRNQLKKTLTFAALGLDLEDFIRACAERIENSSQEAFPPEAQTAIKDSPQGICADGGASKEDFRSKVDSDILDNSQKPNAPKLVIISHHLRTLAEMECPLHIPDKTSNLHVMQSSPSKVINSSKRIRSLLGVPESNVCRGCTKRNRCKRMSNAAVGEAELVDVVRILIGVHTMCTTFVNHPKEFVLSVSTQELFSATYVVEQLYYHMHPHRNIFALNQVPIGTDSDQRSALRDIHKRKLLNLRAKYEAKLLNMPEWLRRGLQPDLRSVMTSKQRYILSKMIKAQDKPFDDADPSQRFVWQHDVEAKSDEEELYLTGETHSLHSYDLAHAPSTEKGAIDRIGGTGGDDNGAELNGSEAFEPRQRFKYHMNNSKYRDVIYFNCLYGSYVKGLKKSVDGSYWVDFGEFTSNVDPRTAQTQPNSSLIHNSPEEHASTTDSNTNGKPSGYLRKMDVSDIALMEEMLPSTAGVKYNMLGDLNQELIYTKVILDELWRNVDLIQSLPFIEPVLFDEASTIDENKFEKIRVRGACAADTSQQVSESYSSGSAYISDKWTSSRLPIEIADCRTPCHSSESIKYKVLEKDSRTNSHNERKGKVGLSSSMGMTSPSHTEVFMQLKSKKELEAIQHRTTIPERKNVGEPFGVGDSFSSAFGQPSELDFSSWKSEPKKRLQQEGEPRDYTETLEYNVHRRTERDSGDKGGPTHSVESYSMRKSRDYLEHYDEKESMDIVAIADRDNYMRAFEYVRREESRREDSTISQGQNESEEHFYDVKKRRPKTLLSSDRPADLTQLREKLQGLKHDETALLPSNKRKGKGATLEELRGQDGPLAVWKTYSSSEADARQCGLERVGACWTQTDTSIEDPSRSGHLPGSFGSFRKRAGGDHALFEEKDVSSMSEDASSERFQNIRGDSVRSGEETLTDVDMEYVGFEESALGKRIGPLGREQTQPKCLDALKMEGISSEERKSNERYVNIINEINFDARSVGEEIVSGMGLKSSGGIYIQPTDTDIYGVPAKEQMKPVATPGSETNLILQDDLHDQFLWDHNIASIEDVLPSQNSPPIQSPTKNPIKSSIDFSMDAFLDPRISSPDTQISSPHTLSANPIRRSIDQKGIRPKGLTMGELIEAKKKHDVLDPPSSPQIHERQDVMECGGVFYPKVGRSTLKTQKTRKLGFEQSVLPDLSDYMASTRDAIGSQTVVPEGFHLARRATLQRDSKLVAGNAKKQAPLRGKKIRREELTQMYGEHLDNPFSPPPSTDPNHASRGLGPMPHDTASKRAAKARSLALKKKISHPR